MRETSARRSSTSAKGRRGSADIGWSFLLRSDVLLDHHPGGRGLSARAGRVAPRIEDRANTIEARKPWMSLGMSRRTWYRRQAEKRKAPGVIPA